MTLEFYVVRTSLKYTVVIAELICYRHPLRNDCNRAMVSVLTAFLITWFDKYPNPIINFTLYLFPMSLRLQMK